MQQRTGVSQRRGAARSTTVPRTLESVLAHFDVAGKFINGRGKARCLGHPPDTNPSLALSLLDAGPGRQRIHPKCWASCTPQRVLEAHGFASAEELTFPKTDTASVICKQAALLPPPTAKVLAALQGKWPGRTLPSSTPPAGAFPLHKMHGRTSVRKGAYPRPSAWPTASAWTTGG